MLQVIESYKLSTLLISLACILFLVYIKHRPVRISAILFFIFSFIYLVKTLDSKGSPIQLYYNYIRFVSIFIFFPFYFTLKSIPARFDFLILLLSAILLNPFLQFTGLYETNYSYYAKFLVGSLTLFSVTKFYFNREGKYGIVCWILYLSSLYFLEKWLIVVYVFFPIFFFSGFSFNILNIYKRRLLIYGSLLVFLFFAFFYRDTIANWRGYEDFDTFYNVRVTRNYLEENQRFDKQIVGGLSDGGRTDLYLEPIAIQAKTTTNLLFGLDPAYIHSSGIPDHNILLFFYVRGGFVVVIVLLFLVYAFRQLKLEVSRNVFYVYSLHVLLNLFVGESYGIPLTILIHAFVYSRLNKLLDHEV